MKNDYQSPINGWIDLNYPFSFTDFSHYFVQRNSPKRQIKNDKGQITGGDVYIELSYHIPLGSNDSPILDSATQAQQANYVNGDQPLAILAIPRRYGNYFAITESIGLLNLEWFRKELDFWNKLDDEKQISYTYFLVSLGQLKYDYPITYYYNEEIRGRYLRGITGTTLRYNLAPITLDKKEIIKLSSIFNSTSSQKEYRSLPINSAASGYKKLFVELADSLNEYAIKSLLGNANGLYGQNTYNSLTLDRIKAAVIVAQASEYRETVNNLYVIPLTDRALKIGSRIETSFPVFTINSIQQMVRYFAGVDYESDNDINYPPSDWSTDWDVWIKGAQRPNIYITMSSTNVDRWLENSDENTSGSEKNDISVEYRYKVYERNNNLNSPQLFTGAYTYVDDKTMTYNVSRETTYLQNVDSNYPNILSILMPNGTSAEFSDIPIEELFNYYAQLEFRIVMGKYKSSWCGYHVGIIGSPSVPDFALMDNWGKVVDSWTDNSTVTLHYDKIPPEFDPYPDQPDPDMPEIDDTDPQPIQPGLNGIGLLTTTYKLSIDQAKALGRFMWTSDGTFQKILALNLSPIENVVGVTIMPINIPGSTSVIVIGDVDTNINADKITTIPIYELGSVELKGRYQSFLDYTPYTEVHIFLPFVGFVRINPSYFTNKTLSVKYSYDVIMGTCLAMLFVNGIYVESHQGRCGVTIPLVSTNRAELEIGALSTILAGAVSGGLLGAAVGIGKSATDYINGFSSQRQNSYSPTLAWTETRQCYLVIESVNAARTSSYNHDKGRPCWATYNLGQLRGFTICCEDVDVSGISGMTDEELAQIREVLTTGIYL